MSDEDLGTSQGVDGGHHAARHQNHPPSGTDVAANVSNPANFLPLLHSLEEQVERNRETLDVLKEEGTKRRAWSKDPSFMVAALALAVSILSVIIAQNNTAFDRGREDQQRLVELVQRLPTLRAPEFVDEG
jgi:hypothetical protein